MDEKQVRISQAITVLKDLLAREALMMDDCTLMITREIEKAIAILEGKQ
jgi:hypothetical protein